MSALDFDPDRHRDPHEPEHHWALRRRFLAHNMGRYPEEKLVSLAQVFANMEFLGCRLVSGLYCMLFTNLLQCHTAKMILWKDCYTIHTIWFIRDI